MNTPRNNTNSPLPSGEGNIQERVIFALKNDEVIFTKIKKKGYISDESNEDLIGRINMLWSKMDPMEKNELVIYTGLGEIITAGDWAVDRTKEAEQCLGLKESGFHKMQDTLTKKYLWEAPVHLHKGFGDGALMKHLKKPRIGGRNKKKWLQKGIADKVYFSLEKLFTEFRPKYYTDNPARNDTIYDTIRGDFLGLFSAIVKKELKKKWFKSSGSAISQWEKKGAFCDVNDVYDIVENIRKNIENYIPQVYNENTGEFTVSIDFESDRKQLKMPEMDYLMLRFLGKKHDLAKNTIQGRKNKYLEGPLQGAGREDLNNRFTKGLDELDTTFCNFERDRFIGNFLGANFFVDQKNLNSQVAAYTENTTIGDFKEIHNIYGQNSTHLITATRSDSHENDEDFSEDIRGNIETLKPGGILFTDGVRHSFTRIHRFDAIHEAIKGRTDIQVTIVCDSEGNPISTMIQKEPEEGQEYLNDDDKKQFLDNNHTFRTLEEVLRDNVISLDTRLRRKIREAGGIDTFNGILDYIPKAVANIINVKKGKKTEGYYEKVFIQNRERFKKSA